MSAADGLLNIFNGRAAAALQDSSGGSGPVSGF